MAKSKSARKMTKEATAEKLALLDLSPKGQQSIARELNYIDPTKSKSDTLIGLHNIVVILVDAINDPKNPHVQPRKVTKLATASEKHEHLSRNWLVEEMGVKLDNKLKISPAMNKYVKDQIKSIEGDKATSPTIIGYTNIVNNLLHTITKSPYSLTKSSSKKSKKQ